MSRDEVMSMLTSRYRHLSFRDLSVEEDKHDDIVIWSCFVYCEAAEAEGFLTLTEHWPEPQISWSWET